MTPLGSSRRSFLTTSVTLAGTTSLRTGALNFTGHYAPVGNPSIIVFLDLNKAG
jgi:hypothetical protein